MVDTCPLSTDRYKITALTGPVGAGSCGNRVVVKDASIFFIAQNQHGPGNCTYSLFANNDKGVLNINDNLVIEDNPSVNEWIITAHRENTYVIMKKGTELGWTDPGGPRNCEHQLHLSTVDLDDDNIPVQHKFFIVHVD